MSRIVAEAFSPSGISSFFQICDTGAHGEPLMNPELIGARGGGFALEKGVLTTVSIERAEERNIRIFINGRLSWKAETTRRTAEEMLKMTGEAYNVEIRHEVEVPVGAGFGTSAAGALGTATALSKALGLDLTYSQIGRIAHIAEVECGTGLGTVSGLLIGGCVIVKEPGVPGFNSVDRIPIPSNHYIIAGVYAPKITSKTLKKINKELINRMGAETLKRILDEPSLENFMDASREFAEKTGLATERTIKLMDEASEAGAIGAAQNMLGEAVHALVPEDKLSTVLKAFKRSLPEDRIIISRIDKQGIRLIR